MDKIILGLLFLGSRTIYQLRDRINRGMNLMYSSSMGSIQAAIKKLLDRGHIRYTEMVGDGKYRKIYSITDSGKACFLDWVNSPMEPQGAKNPELTKVYFMGMADGQNREAILEKYVCHLKEQYNALRIICKEADSAEVPAEHRDIVFFQLAAARYGRDLMAFNIRWYENLLREVKGWGKREAVYKEQGNRQKKEE